MDSGNLSPIWANANLPPVPIPVRKGVPFCRPWRREKSPVPAMKVTVQCIKR